MKYNILLPIAGKAQRFVDEGYLAPKPLIIAKTKQVIDWAMESIDYSDSNLIFVVRLEHINDYGIDQILKNKFGDQIKIVIVDHDTEGSISTCLLAKDYIDNDIPLIVYTPDVYFEKKFDVNNIDKSLDGLILTFKANSTDHSYVKLDKNDYVIETREKQVISNDAAVGVYYYKHGKMFVKYAEELVNKNLKTNNEFYICPMYNLLVRDGLKIKINQVEKLHVLGTPKELEFFVDKVANSFGELPIGLCSDHSGYKIKEIAKEILTNLNIKYIDFGCYVEKDIDYNQFVIQATEFLRKRNCNFILGFCRTGQGINILANKQKETRAALIYNKYSAEMAVRHNCANFFSIPSKEMDYNKLSEIITIIKNNSFDGGRHISRVEKYI